MRYKIDFTPNLILGPNGESKQGVEGTYYVYDTQRDCERLCYATTLEFAELIQQTLEEARILIKEHHLYFKRR